MIAYKRILFLLLLSLLCQYGKATHIVGGEMNYTCLGNNEYEITLTIFRDCFNGNPNAWFDDPASIGIFDENNVLLEEVLIDLMGNDTLDPVLTSECLVVPPNVCVHTTTYTTVVELPPIPGGYQLAYQRCCRNQTIINIIDPLDTGATYGVTISEAALNECNSNPKFQQWPPIYICVNEPIVFDQSAIDQDGDSIVYRLCTPLSGANPDIPQPQPPNNPPYEPISWVDPPYNVDNMLNGIAGGVPLEIDSETGLLTGLPNTIGQFVVGICVEEYRNGTLISTTRRDFQYNVGECGEASAAFAAPEVQCGNLSVAFDNLSDGASNFIWYFNDPENPGATSTATNPVYIYSDTGLYTVMLIAAPGEVCEDTAFQEIYLQDNTIEAGFLLEQGPCSDSVIISASDQSTDNLYGITSWEWILEPGGQTANQPNPEFVISESGQYELQLTVTSGIGCTQEISATFTINLIEETLIGDTVTVCQGDSIGLNPTQEGSYAYQWADNPDIADSQSPNPVVSPLQTSTYTVTITDVESGCENVEAVTVFIPEPITAEAPPDTTICSQEILLVGQSNTGQQFFWALDDTLGNVVSTTDSLLADPQGPSTYYFLARDGFGCSSLDSVTIQGNAVDVITSSQQAICPGEFGSIAVINLDSQDSLSVSWSPDDFIVTNPNNPSAFVLLEEPGTYWFYAETTNQFGCSTYDSTTLTLIDTSEQVSFLTEVQCSDYNVLFTSTSVNAPFYNWSFGDPNDSTATALGSQVSHMYSAPGTYEVTITLSSSINCPDTIIQEITLGESNITPDFDWEISNCTDSITLQLTDQSINNQSEIEEWEWSFSNGQSSPLQNPTLTLNEGKILSVQLNITSNDGCQDSILQEIPIDIPELNLPDTLIACLGDSIGLNPEASAEFTYQWSPADLLSDPTLANPQVLLDNSQAFSLIATSLDGDCQLEREVYALVPPDFEYELAPDTALCNDGFLLYMNSEILLDVVWHQVYNGDTVFVSSDPEVLVYPQGPTQYLATLTDEFGCVKRDSVLADRQIIQVFLPNSASICQDDTTELEVINLLGDSLEYQWGPAADILSGQGTPNALVAPGANQTFSVTITNSLGCTVMESTLVQTSDNIPPLEITAATDTLFAPGAVQLEATLDPTYQYFWGPPQGLNNITVFNPVAQVDSTVTYKVEVLNEDGCANEAEITITLFTDCLPPFIYVPNAFTPNGDQLNDELIVRGNTIDEFYFAIYNRWGQLVFESYDPNLGWDGTFEGEALPADVFAYYLEVSCFNGENYFEKGNISLIR